MKRSFLFWIFAFLITACTLVYQRVTGPTYPLSGKVTLNGKEIGYTLNRAHPGETNHVVKIETNDETITGYLLWKRHKTADEWKKELMLYHNGVLTAELPHQPPAGKLNYQIVLNTGNESITIPEDNPVVIRFRGDVPSIVLIFHVLAMFIGLLLSTRAGFECFSKEPRLKQITVWTIIVTAVGGLVMGPLMQWYAFGAFWTGFPFGIDLTDNKTAVALLFWIIAAIALRRSKTPKRWVLVAAIITLIVYLIPHSVLGSELDYSKIDKPPISMTVK